MRHSAPPCLEELSASDAGARERAWQSFLSDFSALVLHVIRRTAKDHDIVMDRYVFVLDALRRDDFRRLRRYREEGRGKFTTWLVAVVRRLCVDEHRARYGRPQAGDADWQVERKSLIDLVSDELALENLEVAGDLPDVALEARESLDMLRNALEALPTEQRLILRLRFEDDVSVPVIAKMLRYDSAFRLYREVEKILSGLRQSISSGRVRERKA